MAFQKRFCLWQHIFTFVIIISITQSSLANEFAFDQGLLNYDSEQGGSAQSSQNYQEYNENYGPCSCFERGTLLQWSYGTSFSGGPNLDEPLVTDRPDFTEASSTVGRGVVQLEFGYTYTYNDDAGQAVRTNSYGEPLLRYGILAEWLEFRIGLFPVERRTTTAGSSTNNAGTEDMYLGLKIALTPQEGIWPEMAILPQMNVPTGSGPFTSGNVAPGVNWLYSWEVNDWLSVAGSTQGNRSTDDSGQSYFEVAQSVATGFTLTERFTVYTEWYGQFPNGAVSAPVQHYFNGGFAYLISDNVQFDIRAGVGLNNRSDDFFLGTGFSLRFP